MREVADDAARVARLAAGGIFQSQDGATEGGLASAGFADRRDDFADLDRQIDTIDGAKMINDVAEHALADREMHLQPLTADQLAAGLIFRLQRILDACRTTPQATPNVTPQVKRLLEALDGEQSRETLMKRLELKDAKHFRRHYLVPALEAGLVEMTQPDSPRSPTQKYRMTVEGFRLIERRND